MNGARFLEIFFVCGLFSLCEGITNHDGEKNLIGEEERRGVDLKKDIRFHDQGKSSTQKRGLWIIGQAKPQTYPTGTGYSGYGSSATGGYQGYEGSGYATTGTGYGLDTGDNGGYYTRPASFGHSAIGTNFAYSGHGGGGSGHSGGGFGHSGQGVSFGNGGSGYGVTGYGDSQGSAMYKKLALKKLLIPLAGLAILGAAAALSSNPVLLQLGTISGKRRRRSIEEDQDVYPANPVIKPS